jgi:hypothetical protein
MSYCESLLQDYLVVGILVIIAQKILVGFVLHFQKLGDPIFAPTQFAQIIAATAFVEFEQKFVVVFVCWSQAD